MDQMDWNLKEDEARFLSVDLSRMIMFLHITWEKEIDVVFCHNML